MHLVCPACLTTNRVPEERLQDEPVCGRCGAALFDAQPLALDEAGFAAFTQRHGRPLLIDCWADWCGPCRAMAPQFAQAARQLPQVRFAKLDTEAHPAISRALDIRSIPTLVLFHEGRERARQSGLMQAGELVRWLQQQLAGRAA